MILVITITVYKTVQLNYFSTNFYGQIGYYFSVNAFDYSSTIRIKFPNYLRISICTSELFLLNHVLTRLMFLTEDKVTM